MVHWNWASVEPSKSGWCFLSFLGGWKAEQSKWLLQRHLPFGTTLSVFDPQRQQKYFLSKLKGMEQSKRSKLRKEQGEEASSCSYHLAEKTLCLNGFKDHISIGALRKELSDRGISEKVVYYFLQLIVHNPLPQQLCRQNVKDSNMYLS